uniref:SPARC n=1 Tax=Callorhinchus milii TaxID=7868 RepID=A0A4W3J2H3_CALMI|eukprot:gi/632949329/ref/XP_007890096.1/ PREDICTED: SPARC-like protein 1 isoform X2 [Callorhinchus milii]
MNPLVDQQYFLYPRRSHSQIPSRPRYYPEVFPAVPPEYSPYHSKSYQPFHSQYFARYPDYAQQPFYSDYNEHPGSMVYDSYPYKYHLFPLIKRIHNLVAYRLGHHSTGNRFGAIRESAPQVTPSSMENTRTEKPMENITPRIPSLDGIFMYNKPNEVPHVSEHNTELAHFTGNYLEQSTDEITDEEDPYDVLRNSDSIGVEHFRSSGIDISYEQVGHDITSSESADETLNNQELESQGVSQVDYVDDDNETNKAQDIRTESVQMTDSDSRGDSSESNTSESTGDGDENRVEQKTDLRVESTEDNTAEDTEDSEDEDSKADLRNNVIDDDKTDSNEDYDNDDGKAHLGSESTEDNSDESTEDDDNSKADLMVDSNEDNSAESNEDSDEDSEADLRMQSIEDSTAESTKDSDEDSEADLRGQSIEDSIAESNDDSDEDSEADLKVQSIEDLTAESNDDSDEDSEAKLRVQSTEDSTAESTEDSNEDSEADLRVQSIEDLTAESNDGSDEDSEADLRVQSPEDLTAESNDDSNEDIEADLRVHSPEDLTAEFNDDSDEDSKANLRVQSIEDLTAESNDGSDEDSEADLRVQSPEDLTAEFNDDSDEDSEADQRARLIEDNTSESSDDSNNNSAKQPELNADSSALKYDESNEGDSNESNSAPRSLQENPCNNHPCKRGKVCELDNEGKPMCVCQDTSTCPASTTDSQHVCGTNNRTYESSCQFFASKCILEGTKKGHGLHLDYFGPCKDTAPCQDNELLQFPLRLRNWLKNVLMQMYERDLQIPGILTEKQRNRVKKIYDSEKNLHAGDHLLDLPYSDFKNYYSFIYPVHWQFRQLDQHPTDGYLSHSELAPLRAPLVPIEHCTSRFFTQCNTDGDRFLSLREWAHCFDISEEDINPDLTF